MVRAWLNPASTLDSQLSTLSPHRMHCLHVCIHQPASVARQLRSKLLCLYLRTVRVSQLVG